jgi:hypothetical protein
MSGVESVHSFCKVEVNRGAQWCMGRKYLSYVSADEVTLCWISDCCSKI